MNQGVGFVRAASNLACDLQRELALLKQFGKTHRRRDHRVVLIMAATQHQRHQARDQALAIVQPTEENDGLLIVHRALYQVAAQ